jgi:protein phosphatase
MIHSLRPGTPDNVAEAGILPAWDEPAPTSTNNEPAVSAAENETFDIGFSEGRAGSGLTEPVACDPGTLASEAKPRDIAETSQEAPLEDAPPSESLSRELCPHCQSPREKEASYCAGCGWIFPEFEPAALPGGAIASGRLRDRYEIRQKLAERYNVSRYRGLDYATDPPTPVILVRGPSTQPAQALDDVQESEPAAGAIVFEPGWPSVQLEHVLLQKLEEPTLPLVIETFCENGSQYLVEELPAGQPLWDAWDDPAATAADRFGWAKQIAGALQQLHHCHAILEALRPDIVVVGPGGQARLTDLSDLLPLPLPTDPPIRATFYSAPELILSPEKADARADLYSFGAMLYALHLGHELTELDFELQGVPKSIIERFPDVHPQFARLVSKTFCREPGNRYPTQDRAQDDPTGFAELTQDLDVCARTMDRGRLEIASWSTTGMIRSGNEDAFAVVHASEWRENDCTESALVLLADGMGGYEAGEVAAALAIQALRRNLLQQNPFAILAGSSPSHSEGEKPNETMRPSLDVESCKQMLAAALKDANQQVYAAARESATRQRMGCTAEVVYVDGRHIVVGHVGDSRAYHLHRGELTQLTRDQTWVNRMVDLGTISPEEAAQHPRSSELQQAIGARSDVEPGLYSAILRPGDWVVVCSDGIPNHVSPEMLKELLQSSRSAESAARRLVNLVNLRGATDNATAIVIRVT